MMRKRRIRITALVAAVALSGGGWAHATMPAGAPRTQKDRENALYRYVSDMAGRVGQASGDASKATGQGAAKLYDAAGKGAEALYEEMGNVCREAGEGVAEFCTKNYQKVQKDLSTRGSGPQNVQRGSNTYAPWNRSRDSRY